MLAQIVLKNSHLVDPMNDYLHRFLAAGLIDKWTDDTTNIFNSDNRVHLRNSSTTERAQARLVLGLPSLTIAFIVLAIGLILSTLAFFIEIICTPFSN